MRLIIDTDRGWLAIMRFSYRRIMSEGTTEPDGIPGRRSADHPCNGYEPRKSGLSDWNSCQTDGHYLCRECCHKNDLREYSCFSDCDFLLEGGGPFDNPHDGGCRIEGRFPGNTTFDMNDEDLIACPFYMRPLMAQQ